MASSKQRRPGQRQSIGHGAVSQESGGAGYSIFEPSAAYLAELNKPSRTPAYFFEYRGVTERFGTHSEMGFPNMLYYMADAPDSHANTVYPEEGRASFLSGRIPLLDFNGEVSALMDDLEGRFVTMRAGFLPLPENAYISHPVGIADEVEYIDGIYYQTTRDPFAKMAKKIFNVATTSLIAECSATTDTLYVVDTSFFDEAGYARMDNEIIYHTGKTASFLTGCTRNLFNTFASIHAAGAQVRECIRRQVHLADHAKEIVINGGKLGCSIPQMFVNEASFSTWKTNLGSSTVWDFWIDGQRDAYTYFQELCRIGTAYPALDAQGRIGVQDYRTPSVTDTITEWSAMPGAAGSISVLLDAGRSPRQMIRRRSTRINKVVVHYDKDRVTGEFSSQQQFSRIIGQRGEWPIDIYAHGLYSTNPGTQLFLETISEQILNRYASNASEFTIKLLMREHLRIGGEIIKLSHPDLPDLNAGVLGFSNKYMEIIQRVINWPKKDGSGGYVDTRVLDTNIGQLLRVWASDSVEDWGDPGLSSTELAHNVWWANDSGEHSDASPAYLWGLG